MLDFLPVLSLFPLLLAAALVLWNRLRLHRVFKHFDSMLDNAIGGEFQEEVFDESRLSAVESKLPLSHLSSPENFVLMTLFLITLLTSQCADPWEDCNMFYNPTDTNEAN